MAKRTAAIAALVLATLLPVSVVNHADAKGAELKSVVAAVQPAPTMKFTWGWITGTVYFNRRETRSMRTVTAAASAAATVCATMGTQTFGLACGLSGVAVHQWSYVAANAYSSRRCVKIKLPAMWASAYSGGYCK